VELHFSGNGVTQALDALLVFDYAPTTMSKIRLWIDGGVLLFAFLVMVPSIAAAIGYAAWNGIPRSFSREMYFTAFVLIGGVSTFLLVYAIRMNADIRTWEYLWQVACFGIATLLFGVASGCMIGVFAYRRSSRHTY
jgi:uncharacterized membrane protein